MKHMYRIVAAISSLCLLSFSDGNRAKTKPTINVYGTIVDAAGNTYAAENITIAGSYRQIVMYIKPEKTSQLPEHEVKIDLPDIHSITVMSKPDGKPVNYQQRTYVAVSISSPGDTHTHNTYIIEKAKRLRFDIQHASGQSSHETPLTEITSITIAGHRRNNEPDTKDLPAPL
ncbi:MAG: hypothetical protein WCE21_05740 [Candidatus Babeliales bacterium]